MKEANALLRERFAAGVSGAGYARIRKLVVVSGNGSTHDGENGKAPQAAPIPDARPHEMTLPQTSAAPATDLEVHVHMARPGHETSTSGSASPALKAQVSEEPMSREPETASAVLPAPSDPTTPVAGVPVRIEVDILKAKTVHIAGSFNHWNIRQHELKRGNGCRWIFEDRLPPGEHYYKFVVDGREWFLDMDRERFLDPTGVSHRLVLDGRGPAGN